MKITRFQIENFKGIDSLSIDVFAKNNGGIVTLIGLNESGKTTILEAISHFFTKDKYASSLVRTVQQDPKIQDLIPKYRKAAFSGSAIIQANIQIDELDKESICNLVSEKYGMICNKDAIPNEFTVETCYKFEDSSYIATEYLWDISFMMKKKGMKKYSLVSYDEANPENTKIWDSAVTRLSELMPRIVYFPTFLFNFPDRIYLSDIKDNINHYYTQILQDIFDNNAAGLSIQKHIIDRIDRLKNENKESKSFFSLLMASDEKRQIDAVIQSLSNEISKIVFGAWSEILGKNVTGKRIQIDWLIDADKGNIPYIELTIVDGHAPYSLSERSLGFRWFFSFLLFTQFRRNRKDSTQTIFLFDEPASNLHSRAQIKLLETFKKISNERTFIIYSTHSHYMINPLWLENSYIIQNQAAVYDKDNDVDSFEIVKTDIKAIKYRTFVGRNPTETTYFQPALDALEVTFSPLLRSRRAIIIEGKYDYHPFVYFNSITSKEKLPEIFPACGAGHLASLISLFRGWDVEFRIILDDDQAGRREKLRYISELLVGKHEIFTIGDIISDLKGKSFESIFQGDVSDEVKSFFGIENIDKRHYALFFQSKIFEKARTRYNATEESFVKILEWIEANFPKSGDT